jgi:hypothetical protein
LVEAYPECNVGIYLFFEIHEIEEDKQCTVRREQIITAF